jgi:hypothetical protein
MSQVSATHWATLAQLYLERTRRALLSISLSVGPLTLFFAWKSRFDLGEVFANIILVTAMLPMALGGVVGKCKADGSLAFLASLPVSRNSHARSWVSACALLTLPLGIAVAMSAYMGPIDFSAVEAVVMAVAAMVFAVAMVMILVAVQLRVPPGTSIVYFGMGFAVLITVLGGVGQLAEWFPQQFAAMLRSELLVPVASLLLWGAAAGALRWSWGRIGHYMTSYVGDPPEA